MNKLNFYMNDARISVDKIKEILQSLLKDHEAIICSDFCFYDFNKTSSIWEYIATLVHYHILEAMDSNALKPLEKVWQERVQNMME